MSSRMRQPGSSLSSSASELLTSSLQDPEAAWSLGTPGALAEFFREADEELSSGTCLSEGRVVTPRGAIAVRPAREMQAIAYERASERHGAWQQGVVFCLPSSRATLERRRSITELGSDRHSLTPSAKHHLLFDLGLDIAHINACVRTDDPALIESLRGAAGRSFWSIRSGLPRKLVERSPHRVLISKLARIEVHTPIPLEHTPRGPHTHILRGLSSHPELQPVPDGWTGCLTLHPPNPSTTKYGEPRSFDETAHAGFQRVLEAHGSRDYLARKEQILKCLERGAAPPIEGELQDPAWCEPLRVATRQFATRHGGELPLDEWCRIFEY